MDWVGSISFFGMFFLGVGLWTSFKHSGFRMHHVNSIYGVDKWSWATWLKLLSFCGLFGNAAAVLLPLHSYLEEKNTVYSSYYSTKFMDEQLASIRFYINHIIFWAILFCVSLIAIWVLRSKFQKTHPHWREADFYDLCVKEGISSSEDKADVARARLVAKKYSISVPKNDDDFIAFFRRGQEIVMNEEKQAEKNANENELEAEKIKENNEKVRRERFTAFTGREKRNRMLQHEIDVYQNAISNSTKGSTSASPPFLKEQSWGLAGGIASGIAGPAAGLAAAADTMAYNQQVKEYNQAAAQFYAMAAAQGVGGYTSPSSTKQYYEKKIKELKKRQEDTTLKLVDEDCDIQELFQHLHFSEEKISVSKTGAVRVTVRISADMLPRRRRACPLPDAACRG